MIYQTKNIYRYLLDNKFDFIAFCFAHEIGINTTTTFSDLEKWFRENFPTTITEPTLRKIQEHCIEAK